MPVTRTLWSSRYGPIVNNVLGLSLPWTTTKAFTMRDANAGNVARALNTWFGFDRAQTTRQVLTVLDRYQGIPWVNTWSRTGRARPCTPTSGPFPACPTRWPALATPRWARDLEPGPDTGAERLAHRV